MVEDVPSFNKKKTLRINKVYLSKFNKKFKIQNKDSSKSYIKNKKYIS